MAQSEQAKTTGTLILQEEQGKEIVHRMAEILHDLQLPSFPHGAKVEVRSDRDGSVSIRMTALEEKADSPTSLEVVRRDGGEMESGETEAEHLSISPRAYLRSMLAMAWGALRHPFSTTVVDLSTGDSVSIPPRKEALLER